MMPSQAARTEPEPGAWQNTEQCAPGVCADDAPPLVGSILTGTGLTLEAAAKRLVAGEPLPPMTDVQRRMVEAHAGGER
jgi:hypothetical protein